MSSLPFTDWTVHSDRVLWRHYPVRGADAATFVALSETWARDVKNVYCQKSVLRGADVSTFEVLNPLWARDRFSAYYTYGRIADADALTFKALDSGIIPLDDRHDHLCGGYASDGKSVYFYMMTIGKPSKLPRADPASFHVVNPRFARDCQAAYYERFRIPGADPTSLSVLGGIYCTDGQQVFYGNTPVPGAHAASFVVSTTDPRCAQDRSANYLRGEPV